MSTAPFRHPVLAVSHGPGPKWLLSHGEQSRTSTPAKNVAGIWKKLYPKGSSALKPKRILLISAHWESYRLEQHEISRASAPGMIYDYGGFPAESYELVYAAKGDAEFAEELHGLLAQRKIKSTLVDRGFDHGTFVPLMLLRPQADIPVVTLSINGKLSTPAHFALGCALAPLREQGTLIVCSGQATHGRQGHPGVQYEPNAFAFQEWLDLVLTAEKPLTLSQREAALLQWASAPGAGEAHPRAEHFIPFVVAAAAGMDAETPEAAKLYGGWGGNHLSYATYAWGVAGVGSS